MISIMLTSLFQLNLRIKSLKNQLDISESELDLAQTEKRKIQEENLDKDKEIQVRTYISHHQSVIFQPSKS